MVCHYLSLPYYCVCLKIEMVFQETKIFYDFEYIW